MDSAFGTGDALGVGVASALTPSQVQGWAFNHDSPSGLQDAAAAAAAAGLGLGLGGVGGPEQFRNIQVALEQVNRVQSLAREVMFGMCFFPLPSSMRRWWPELDLRVTTLPLDGVTLMDPLVR